MTCIWMAPPLRLDLERYDLIFFLACEDMDTNIVGSCERPHWLRLTYGHEEQEETWGLIRLQEYFDTLLLWAQR